MPNRDGDLEPSRTRPPAGAGDPWAVALNATAATDDITVTLLAFAVVDDIVRVSGVMRLLRRSDLHLSNLPTLSISRPGGAPLELVRAHALPHGTLLWVSWIYRRPAEVAARYSGRIDRVELAAGTRIATVSGPWAFAFEVSHEGAPERTHRARAVARA